MLYLCFKYVDSVVTSSPVNSLSKIIISCICAFKKLVGVVEFAAANIIGFVFLYASGVKSPLAVLTKEPL